MNMKMRHFLMGIGAVIGKNSITRLGNTVLAGDPPQGAEEGGKLRL